MADDLVKALVDLEEKEVLRIVEERLSAGENPLKILDDSRYAMRAAGLRDKVKIMIGGGQINDEIRRYAGADAYRADAMAAVSLAKESDRR